MSSSLSALSGVSRPPCLIHRQVQLSPLPWCHPIQNRTLAKPVVSTCILFLIGKRNTVKLSSQSVKHNVNFI
jgi:hypothetical protein